MKKIIAASILSLMLLGVGSANSDGDAHTWEFENYWGMENYIPTPIKDCIEASKKGLLAHHHQSDKYVGKFYIYDDKLYKFEMSKSFEPTKIECSSASPKSVIK